MTDPILDLSWPLSLVPGPTGTVTLRTVEQDSDEEIKRGLALACEVRPGDLDWAPDFGTPDPLGGTDLDETAALLAAALRVIDPRPGRIDVTLRDLGDGDRNIHLKVETS
ncbi:hypothetical protein [Patulibacter sp. SYSU D01012]|uniref:hypothetical protein n=1 Tax=Patulibacter sp. SYSU D01012 TaxID=2817381 RepID=UPI001B3020A1|nr:hypothetical protein [Patulibacter sp. SYSU D01012]